MTLLRFLLHLGLAVAAATNTARAHATETAANPPAPPAEPVAPSTDQPLTDKRSTPSYDGRAPAPPTAREGLVWIPRAILLPAHLVTEHVVRRPTVALGRWAERHHLIARVYDTFTWDEGRGGVYPTVAIDFGLEHTGGLTLFDDRFLVDGNGIRLSAALAPSGVVDTNAQDRLRIFRDGAGALYLRSHYVRRPDGVYYGLGPDTRNADKTHFAFVARGFGLGLSANLGGLNRAVVDVNYRDVAFSRSRIAGDTPALEDRHGGLDQPPLPPGHEGYRLLQPRVALVLDTRAPQPDRSPGTGVRLGLESAYAVHPGDTDLRFGTWGGDLAAFYDFSGVGHMVGLELATRFVENHGSRDVPFTELPTLGGLETMRGFLAGRLRGESAIALTAQYRYPFWLFMDTELFAGVGNAFPDRLRGFEPDRLFASYGLSVRTTLSRETSLAATFALGSSRFDESNFDAADAVRFSFGVNHGF